MASSSTLFRLGFAAVVRQKMELLMALLLICQTGVMQLDGTPAPETERRRIRHFRRLDVANQINTYPQEMEKAAQRRNKEGNILEEKR